MDYEIRETGWIRLHQQYLAQRDVAALRVAPRWRAAKRIALVVLLAGAALQFYFLHVYAAIAALPTLAVSAGLTN